MMNIDFSQKVMSRKLPLIRLDNTSAKIEKSNKSASKYKTAILYLAPANTVPDMNLCPLAWAAECEGPCLNLSGRGKFNSVQRARIMKTLFFRDNQAAFMDRLGKDIARELRKAKKKGYKLAIRLNGTSDIDWMKIPYKGHANIMAAFPEVTFYNYTKVVSKARLAAIAAISNYHVTASYSEANMGFARKIASQDSLNIAVVFRDTIPNTFTLANGKTLPVINGDVTDERFLDPTDQQYIVGLLAKGPAKQDSSGFVIDQTNVIARAA